MPELIPGPTAVRAAGTPSKEILEYIGRVNSATQEVSIAVMQSPQGWEEPGQRPEFDEYTLVLEGTVRVTHRGGTLDVGSGQAMVARAGEWVRYATPHAGGARYVSVCMPAFSPQNVHRDEGSE